MEKICKQCAENFEVTDDDFEFFDQIAPVFEGKKYAIPAPDYCPICRLERRMCFRNERSLYHSKCDATGKNIISAFAPDSGYTVYDHDYWWSDQWDGTSYARDFYFSKTLTAQMSDLSHQVPHNSLITTNCINCEYANYLLNSRNCYLIHGGSHDEDCWYGKFVVNCKNVMDCLSVHACEFCYEGNSCESCYHCRFFLQCRNCSDCLMIEECTGCRNCIACFGLKNQEFCFLNQRVGIEKFAELKKQYANLTHAQINDLRQKLNELKKDLPHNFAHIYSSEDCSGDNILNSKNCHNCFDVRDSEDCKNVNFAPYAYHCRDHIFSAPGPTEFCYQTCSIVGNHNSMALFLVWSGGTHLFYCMECHSCSDCIGCIGLKNKKYCILNKQYSREEYEKMAGQVIEHMIKTGEWGQYLDPSISFFRHNESIAQEYFPVSKDEALKYGFKWKDDEKKDSKPATFVISESIDEVSDDATNGILVCENCAKNYKIIPEELKFYRMMKLPLPKKCTFCRHMERINYRNSFKLHLRKCDNCGKEIETTYGNANTNAKRPSAALRVFCEDCYLKYSY